MVEIWYRLLAVDTNAWERWLRWCQWSTGDGWLSGWRRRGSGTTAGLVGLGKGDVTNVNLDDDMENSIEDSIEGLEGELAIAESVSQHL